MGFEQVVGGLVFQAEGPGLVLEVFYFVLFIGVLVFRPAGIFGQRGAETLGA